MGIYDLPSQFIGDLKGHYLAYSVSYDELVYSGCEDITALVAAVLADKTTASETEPPAVGKFRV